MNQKNLGFYCVGSWDDWRAFTPLKPTQLGGALFYATIEVRQPPGLEEFQILYDKQWTLRYYPSKDGQKILGPENKHGANWRVPIPERCWFLELCWDPRGTRRVEWRFLGKAGKELQSQKAQSGSPSKKAVVSKSWFVQGSWDDWKEFIELTPGTRDAEFSARIQVEPEKDVEFNVILGRDTSMRYYPAKDNLICGPTSHPTSDWKVAVPRGQKWLDVVWDPRGDKSLKFALLGAAERHHQAAEEFANLLLEMRSDSPAGVGWLRGMWRIFHALPQCQQHSPYGRKAEPDATAMCLLATLVRDAETMRDRTGPAQKFQRHAFVGLEAMAEMYLKAVSGPLTHPAQADGTGVDWMQAALPHDNTVVAAPPLTLFQRMIHLPLVMYVRNTVHLYELLDRMKAQAKTSTQGGRLRRLLDRKGTHSESPYSWLIYGIIGALQTLRHLRWRSDTGFPLELLASSPPHTLWLKNGRQWNPSDAESDRHTDPKSFARDSRVENCQPMKPLGSFKEGHGLMFRGIWLPEDADDGMLRYQYSFQSFSRCIEGVMRVMRFYSDVNNTKANEAAMKGRMLLYISHSWASNPLVTPVQFFDGPKKKASDSEEELLLPPFMVYDFEDDLSIGNDMEVAEKQELVEELESRWQVVLPELLKNFIYGLLPHLNHTRVQCHEGVNLTVRFIRSMALSPPVARLFEEESCHLYAWSAVGPQAQQQAGEAKAFAPPTRS